MKYKMKLNSLEFDNLKKGTKRIEMRIFDEKRRLLKVGDTIEFTNTTTKETINTVIKDLKTFSSFAELYKNYDKKAIGYKDNEEANPSYMEKYYPKEEQEQYGVVAIELALID